MRLDANWDIAYWPILLSTIGSIALGCAKLMGPDWRPCYSWSSLGLQAVNLVIVALLLGNGASLIITGAEIAPTLTGKLSVGALHIVQVFLLGMGVVCIIQWVLEVRRLWRHSR